jgi:hypothetical protein
MKIPSLMPNCEIRRTGMVFEKTKIDVPELKPLIFEDGRSSPAQPKS